MGITYKHGRIKLKTNMSSKKISQLTATTTTNSTDETVLAVSGATRKITLSNLINGLVKLITTSAKGLTGVNDSNDNEVVKFSGVASAVNEITVTNATTGNAPSITATGGDTNVDLSLKGKGSGALVLGNANVKFPNSDGSAGQALFTNGSATLSFGQIATSGIKTSSYTSITHSLGRTPSVILFSCFHTYSFVSGAGGSGGMVTNGTWTDSSKQYGGWLSSYSGGGSNHSQVSSTSKVGAYFVQSSSASSTADIDVTSVDSTTISLSLPSSVEADNGALTIIWTAY